jgi:hypothetical protein
VAVCTHRKRIEEIKRKIKVIEKINQIVEVNSGSMTIAGSLSQELFGTSYFNAGI